LGRGQDRACRHLSFGIQLKRAYSLARRKAKNGVNRKGGGKKKIWRIRGDSNPSADIPGPNRDAILLLGLFKQDRGEEGKLPKEKEEVTVK